tara:strand:- start:51 stop:491 length:441 start_codon:yes stop_codon:yes gene_type:complete
MKKILLILLFFPFFLSSQNIKSSSYFDELTPEERRIMVKKGTERAGSGIYIDHFDKGVYICKACNNPLFRSEFKFKSDCGWPSFDDEIKGAILRYPDYSYGMKRVEICCANCKGHLGHVFEGEKITEKNIRHCVNSLSIKFVSNKE